MFHCLFRLSLQGFYGFGISTSHKILVATLPQKVSFKLKFPP